MGVIADQRAEIETIVSGVTDVGNVYDYAKLPARGWAPFVAAFSTAVAGYALGADHIRAWTVQYRGERREEETTAAIGTTKYMRALRWRVRGYFTVSDENVSDKVFADLCEAVADALDSRPGLAGSCRWHSPVNISNDDGVPRTFGDVVVHYAELDFDAYRFVTLATS